MIVARFFRIIMPSVLQENKLVLPKKFSEKYGDELSEVTRLVDPAGSIWKVGIEKFGNMFLLCDGWQKFMSHHSILSGYLLHFTYRGDSEFDVRVFNLTALEIQYPSSCSSENPRCNMDSMFFEEEFRNDAKVVKEVEEEDDHDSDKSAAIEIKDSPFAGTRLRSSKTVASIERQNQVSKRRKREASPINLDCESSRSTDAPPPESFNDLNQESCSRKHKSSYGNYSNRQASKASKRALEAANSYKSVNPSFVMPLRSYNIYRVKILNVPAEFSREHLRHCPKHMELHDSDNKKWPVRCIVRGGKLTCLSKGWSGFVRGKELNTGDVCVFELIQTNGEVLKVTVFRAGEV